MDATLLAPCGVYVAVLGYLSWRWGCIVVHLAGRNGERLRRLILSLGR